MSNPVPLFSCRRPSAVPAGVLIALWLALWSGFLVAIVDVAGPRADHRGHRALQNALAQRLAAEPPQR